MLVPTKNLFKSRTFWVNVLGGVVVLLEYLDTIDVSPELLGTALVLANLVLRYLTKQPVAIPGGKEAKSINGGVPLGRER